MRPLFSAFAKKAIGSFFALFVLVLSSAHAAGLGKLTVLSALGHPLKAEIELTAVANDEADSIVVKLASHEAYRQANLEFNSILYSLRFVVEKRGDKHVVSLTSSKAINEPFLGMLLELRSNSGHITREYTFLLDPAELRSASPAVVASVPPPPPRVQGLDVAKAEKPAVTETKPAESKPVEKAPASHQAIAPAPVEKAAPTPAADKPAAASAPESGKPVATEPAKAVAPAPLGKETVKASAAQKPEPVKEAPRKIAKYKVKKGDTLTEIAQKNKYEDVSLEQMLVSLYRANPDAFIAKNMNRLRAGRVLTVPVREEAIKTDHDASRKIIVAHATDFNAYRKKLAEQVAKAAAQREAAGRAAGGAITAEVKDKSVAAKAAQDKLTLSKAEAGMAAGVGLENAAASKALADERARVKELEKNISDLQRLLELKNKQLVAQQKSGLDAAEAKRAADAAAARMAAEKAAAEKLAALKAATQKAAAEKAAADKLAAEKMAAEKAVVAAKLAADKLAAERAKLAAAQQGAAPATGTPPVASAPQVKKPPVKRPIKRVAPPVVQDKGFFGNLIGFINENLMVAAGGAGILILLLVYILIRQRSKKKSLAPLGGSLVGETRDYQNSLFGSSGGQSVDTNNSIFNSGFTPSASLLDANEVDPIAEADVYIAYGREAQAIEILKEALRSHPERNALRVKLLEIYASQKDIQAFDLLAGELYGLTRGEGEEWIYAAGLGMAIDPTNPLYAGGDMSEELLNRPTSLQGSMTQPRQDSEVTENKADAAAHLGYDFVQPSREQLENPDLPLDLGLGTDSVSPPAEADMPMMEAASVPLPDLHFELPTDAASESATAQPAASESLDFNMDDFNEKKDQPSTAGLSVSEPETLDFAQADALSLSTDDIAAEDRDFAAQIAAADEALAAIDQVEPYSPSSAGVDDTSASKPAAPLEFDFGSIDLDLEPKSASVPTEVPQAEIQGDTPRVNSEEMDTKLELAEAYIGIGDKEGARELLDEVMQDGSPEQIEKAKAALAKFS